MTLALVALVDHVARSPHPRPLRRRPAPALLAAAALALTAGCMTGPHNGTALSGSVIGKSITFSGYYNEPNYQIKVQVLSDPGQNPGVNANWITLATTSTGAVPALYADTSDPLYAWSVNATPVPNAGAAARWPQGGLVRIRALHPDPAGDTVLKTFDNVTFNDCALQQTGWAGIGTACVGLGATSSAVVSTSNTPVLPGGPGAFSAGGFLARKGSISAAETEQYYAQIGAQATLAQFKTAYGFPGTEVTATYYNHGDLGLGREMHCKTFITPAAQVGVACYVSNYSGASNGAGVGIAAFNVAENTVLADAVARQHAFATVAMVYEPTFAPNQVKFMVYDAAGNRASTAQLDSTGNNLSIPNNCLSCHGISSSYNPGTNSVSTEARFLPFDPDAFHYSAAPGFTYAAQADAFRRLNQLVKLTNTNAAINEFIDGLYAPKLVSDPTAVANPDFVPADWTNATDDLDDTALYKGVVKPACRTCHMSSSNANLDFADYSDFIGQAAVIRADVCSSAHIMPHAERVMKNFWQSGARAYLITGLPPAAYPDPLGACKP